MYDALLFDLDGTLVDTETVAITAGMAAFAAQGHVVSLAFMHSLVGVDEPTGARSIAQALPDLDQVALRQDWQSRFVSATERELLLKPGVAVLLAAGFGPMAVVTSSSQASAQRKLARVGLLDHFATVVTLDDVTTAKPAPEPYLLAAQRLSVSPARCLVFEDSETGAEAAHRAGCTVVQIPDVVPSQGRWAHHLAEDLLSGARLAGLRL